MLLYLPFNPQIPISKRFTGTSFTKNSGLYRIEYIIPFCMGCVFFFGYLVAISITLVRNELTWCIRAWREASPPERPKRMARWWSTITPLLGLGAVAWNWMVCGFVAWFFKEMKPREGEMDVKTRCWKDVYTWMFLTLFSLMNGWWLAWLMERWYHKCVVLSMCFNLLPC